MSLETEIAALTAVNNKLVEAVNGKMAGINAAVSAAVAAAPEIVRSFWVDPIQGSDEGLGTAASPFKTLARCVAATPSGGRFEAWLAKDYTLDRHCSLLGRKAVIRAEPGSGRRLILNEFLPEGDTLMRMGSFWQTDNSSLEFSNVTISFPASSPGDLSGYYSLTFSSGSTAPALHQLRFYNCALELRGSFRGKLFGAGTTLYLLSLTGTAIPAALAGSIIPGVAAGTDTKTLPNVITNAATL